MSLLTENRIGNAFLALSLHQDGVISVKDIDLVMSEGLGMRYAFLGPMETIHLNAPEGIASSLDISWLHGHVLFLPPEVFKVRVCSYITYMSEH